GWGAFSLIILLALCLVAWQLQRLLIGQGDRTDETPEPATEDQSEPCDDVLLQVAPTLFEAAGEGMVIMDADFRLLAVNDACCALSGYGREELVGYQLEQLASSESSRQQYEAMR